MEVKKNILLVDDDSVANFLVEKVVASTGMAGEIFKANNGKEAVNVFNLYNAGEIALPELILLDLNMPIMDGFEFIEAFQTLHFDGKEKVVIVIVTSSYHPHDLQKATDMGIKYYLTKPITAEHIKAIMLAEFNKQSTASLL